jgi:hypothetical protein
MVSIIRWRIWTRFRAICKSATWVKLRELSLSYKLNLTNKNLGLESVTFTGTGRNLWLWTEADLGQDPETNLTGNSNGRGLQYFNAKH